MSLFKNDIRVLNLSSVVLDASAMLAYFFNEEGAILVGERLSMLAYIGAVNWAEVLSKSSDKGHSPDNVITTLTNRGLMGNGLVVIPTTEADAKMIAKLRPETKKYGLSLGDRACLALALRLNLPVLTSDRAWMAIDINVSIQMIR